MDANLNAILINLLSQAIWEMRTLINPSPLTAVQRSRPVRESVKEAAAALEDVLGGEIPEPLLEALRSTDTEAIVRALYLHRLDDADLAPREARNAFRAVCRSTPGFPTAVHADAVFEILLAACDATLREAIDEGSLLALDSRAALRHKMLSEQLEAIERFVTPDRFTTDELEQFSAQLRREVASRTWYITPPDFYGAPRIGIDRLYVEPLLSYGHDEPRHVLSLREWIATLRNGVVLGNPGAGKSSLATRVCNEIATASVPVVGGRERVPFIVKLKDYSAAKNDRPLSFADYMAEEIHSSMQLPHAPAMVEHMLLRGSMFVAFDGLDELLDTHHRQEIRDEVESFSRRYPNVLLLITSREVGYPQAALDDERFTVLRLEDFDRERVTAYTTKWFELDDDLSPTDRAHKARAFLEESEAVTDVRRNPLMLALMCNIYQGQGYIPRNRPDVYEKCARMLFDIWDRKRAIKVYLPISEHVEPAMNDLARWIYEDEGRQGGVTESELVERATRYLDARRFDNIHKAREAARNFVEFCRGRAWVFTDTGTGADGEAIYQFTHRTFLEYFTARQLAASHEGPVELADELLPHVERGEWEVVAELGFQIKGRATDGAADALLLRALERLPTLESEAEATTLATFVARCLNFVFPRPGTTVQVAATITRRVTERCDSTVWLARLQALATALRAASDNRDSVRDGVARVIEQGIAAGQREEFELLFGFDRIHSALQATSERDNVEAYWAQFRADLLESQRRSVRDAIMADPGLATVACGEGLLSTREYVLQHGLAALVIPRQARLWGSTSSAHAVVSRAAFSRRSRGTDRDLNLAELAHLMLTAPTPWVTPDDLPSPGSMGVAEAEGVRRYRGDEADAVFVGFCLAAVVHELQQCSSYTPVLPSAWPGSSSVIGSVIATRGGAISSTQGMDIEALERLLNDDRFAFVTAWLRGDLRLVAF